MYNVHSDEVQSIELALFISLDYCNVTHTYLCCTNSHILYIHVHVCTGVYVCVQVMALVSVWSPIVTAGIFAATLLRTH